MREVSSRQQLQRGKRDGYVGALRVCVRAGRAAGESNSRGSRERRQRVGCCSAWVAAPGAPLVVSSMTARFFEADLCGLDPDMAPLARALLRSASCRGVPFRWPKNEPPRASCPGRAHLRKSPCQLVARRTPNNLHVHPRRGEPPRLGRSRSRTLSRTLSKECQWQDLGARGGL